MEKPEAQPPGLESAGVGDAASAAGHDGDGPDGLDEAPEPEAPASDPGESTNPEVGPEAAEDLATAEEPAETPAPPVVAVVVTSDGEGLEATLASLVAQDYPVLSVLVLDSGGAEDPTARIASVAPHAYVRRLPENVGFATAANEALGAVEGAAFLLFCHDDVVVEPSAVRVMVEEAYRSNAGIVGPKIVDLENPDILLEVGLAIDHYGVVFSGIEPGEIDQEQHDAVRDVFFVSSATLLVRGGSLRRARRLRSRDLPGFRRHRSLLARAPRRSEGPGRSRSARRSRSRRDRQRP